MKISKVTYDIYRGTHPLTSDDFAILKAKGIKTILNLERGWFAAFHNSVNDEFISATNAGMNVLNLQLDDLIPPSHDALECALHVLKLGNVFVHCMSGVDRTGEVVAAYRVKVEGWSIDSAINEMFEMGYHKIPYKWLWLPNLLKYLGDK